MSVNDYVFFSSKTQAFECNHCGGQHVPALPMPIDQFVSMGKGFVLMHKHCQKPEVPSKQVPMFGADPLGKRDPGLQAMCLSEFDDLGIDGSSDEPDPETDPPPPAEDPKVNAVSDHDLLTLLGTLGVQADLREIQSWTHRQLYCTKAWALAPGAWPRPAHFQLLDPAELRHLITCVRPKEFWPSVKEIESWHEQVRADVQRWCRIEHARSHPIAGHPVPMNMAMPSVLANIEHAAKPRRARKAKA